VSDDQQPQSEQPEPEQPTVPVEAGTASEAPTESVPAATAESGGPVTPPADAAAEQALSEAEPHAHNAGPRWVVALVLVLVLGIGGGFLIGRATAPDEGPATLADAVSETAKGDLPVGQLDLQELLQSIGKEKGGALGQILGGDDSSGSDALSGLLGGLIDRLKNGLENGSSSDSSGDSSSSATAYLGVQAQAAPNGTTGVVIGAVAPDSPAADSGLLAGDVVTKVDDTAVASPAELASAIRDRSPGDAVTITYTRNGSSATAKVRLANSASATTPTTTPPTTQAPTNA
jgi:membrane-associated protease RseP (regulator of RpoE activity)